MGTRVLVHRFTVAAPPSAVLAQLAEPADYVGLNPYVVSVADVRELGDVREYTAVERIRVFRLFTSTNVLRVTSRVATPDRRLELDITTRGGIRVRIVTELEPAAGGSDVVDTITLTAPRLLLPYAARQARSAQLAKGPVLERRLGTP